MHNEYFCHNEPLNDAPSVSVYAYTRTELALARLGRVLCRVVLTHGHRACRRLCHRAWLRLGPRAWLGLGLRAWLGLGLGLG